MHESLLGIEVPHGVLGDIWVRLELKRGDKGDHWTSSAWERPYRSDAMNSLCPTSQSDLTRATTRGIGVPHGVLGDWVRLEFKRVLLFSYRFSVFLYMTNLKFNMGLREIMEINE
ncbi:hypothetical protein F2Q68_00006109 [Brassica cretica]|uniref:Uncharacterized protein n=1 Tax=Brassica cretica TaxID=69181 RepID=A0A8S9JL05_BRACR|nr:hypothetical protein F2Q68_00006109 [Brassica cretica]